MTLSTLTEQVARQALSAKGASRRLASLSPEEKKRMLLEIAKALEASGPDILFHNEIDVEAAREAEISEALINRLVLNDASLKAMAQGVREVAEEKDPVGEVLESWTRPSGIRIDKVLVPLGVIARIYDSRPNVTVDAAALCLMSGNAVILRGGSEAINSNR